MREGVGPSPAAAAQLEELLAYAGSRHPPKVHISVQTRTSRALASRYSGDAALVAAASVAAATSYSTIYTDLNATVIVIGCLVLFALAALRLVPNLPSKGSIALALLIALVPQVWWPPIGNVERGPLFRVATTLAMVAGAVLIAAALVERQRRRLAAAAIGCAVLAGFLVVQASGRPAIDVWIILQQSTRGLLRGANPYTMSFTGVPAGQTSDCFNYLPFTFLASLPGRVAFGDVRYAELLVLFAGIGMLLWALARMGRADRGGRGRAAVGIVLVGMAVSLPGTLRVAQQSWNESIILGCLAAAAALVLLSRAWWAVVPLALALATKQHVVLVLPLWALWRSFGPRRALISGGLAAGICLPWALASPSRFYGCTVRFFIDLPARQDSLSVWKFVPHGLQLPAVVVLTAAGYVLASRLLDGTVSGAVFGSGLVFAAFDLANKQSFENQWVLACQLLVLGLACRAVERPAVEPEPPGSTTLEATRRRAAFRHEGADVP
jgi:hypothetical protein